MCPCSAQLNNALRRQLILQPIQNSSCRAAHLRIANRNRNSHALQRQVYLSVSVSAWQSGSTAAAATAALQAPQRRWRPVRRRLDTIGFMALRWAVIPPAVSQHQQEDLEQTSTHTNHKTSQQSTSQTYDRIRTWRNPAPRSAAPTSVIRNHNGHSSRPKLGNQLTAQAQDYCTTFFFFFLD